jgi:hypothetical protein
MHKDMLRAIAWYIADQPPSDYKPQNELYDLAFYLYWYNVTTDVVYYWTGTVWMTNVDQDFCWGTMLFHMRESREIWLASRSTDAH